MRNITFLFIYVLLSSFQLSEASNPNQLLQQLSSVNNEWNKQADGIQMLPTVSIQENKSFDDWIATHLMLVEQTLRARDISNLSSQQKQNRLRLLDKLNGYWHSRAFPVNNYVSYKTPVFIDRIGNHCAVGYLMQQSGAESLAQKINTEQKLAYVHQIKAGGVKEWADENGFTVDELAWIQPAYATQVPTEDLDGGLDGTVNTIAVDQNAQVVYVAGTFNQSVSGVTCNNIAAWSSGFAGWDWLAIGSGVNGTVHALYLQNNKLYVGGEFTMAGGIAANNIAVYDISLGQWQAVGSLDSTVRALTIYNGDLYAGGDFTGYVSKWTGSAWQDVAQGFLYGEGVRTLEVWNGELIIGGSFELATGAYRRHAASYNGTYMGMLGMGTVTPVNDFEIHEGKLYAACDVVSGTDTCALAVYENFDWKVELKPAMGISDYFDGTAIRKIVSTGTGLLAAGDFLCSSMMIYGNNLMEIRKITYPPDTTVYISLNALAIPDQPVHDIALVNNTLYFGGAFVMNSVADTLNHIGTLELTTVSINEPGAVQRLRVYPNPASDMLRIQSTDNRKIEQVEVYDVTGRKILYGNTNDVYEDISLRNLETGFYTVRALIENKWAHSQFVKN